MNPQILYSMMNCYIDCYGNQNDLNDNLRLLKCAKYERLDVFL